MADREAAKRLILKIVAIAGGRLPGKFRLHKAFYAAHVIYWRQREGVLTDYPVVKLPDGPGIDDLDTLLRELVAERRLDVISENLEGSKGPFTQYTLVLRAKVEVDPNEPEYEPISQAVRWVKRRTYGQLREETHGRPSYEAQPRIGYEQPIYLDAIPEDDLNVIAARCAEAREVLRQALEVAD